MPTVLQGNESVDRSGSPRLQQLIQFSTHRLINRLELDIYKGMCPVSVKTAVNIPMQAI